MSLPGEARIRPWPWSAEEDEVRDPDAGPLPWNGSPILLLPEDTPCRPARDETCPTAGIPFLREGRRLIPRALPHARPHGGSSRHAVGEIPLFGASGRRMAVLRFSGAEPPPPQGGTSPLDAAVTAWHALFDDLRAALPGRGADSRLPWPLVCEGLATLPDGDDGPRMALIVHFAETLRRRLEEVTRAARKILLRERAFLPADRVAEMDAACLRWYVRRPGETPAQKAAGHGGRLLAVTRRESFDTLENRVLRDVLRRCVAAARDYERGQVAGRWETSQRAILVRRFRNLCADLLADARLAGVSPLASRVRPNHVLQDDIRYREVWMAHRRLLRQEDERDRVWAWQGRTWADAALILAGAALRRAFAPLAESSAAILREQERGARLGAGCEPGPFLIRRHGGRMRILEIVRAGDAGEHPLARRLGRLCASFLLVSRETGTDGAIRVLAVWAAHTASAVGGPDREAIRASALRGLHAHNAALRQEGLPRVSGLILADTLADDAHANNTFVDATAWAEGLSVAILPADPRRWAESAGGRDAAPPDEPDGPDGPEGGHAVALLSGLFGRMAREDVL